jgi:hypothetical protein
VDDTGADVRVSGLSFFRACEMYRAGEDLDTALAAYQSAAKGRINWIRWMLTKPASGIYPGWTRPPAQLLPEFYAYCYGKGIIPYVSLVTEVHSSLSWLPEYIEVLRSLPCAPTEGVNEPDDRKNDADAVWAQGLSSLPIVTNGYYDPASRWRGTFFDVHPDRKTDTGPTPQSPYQSAGEHFDMASQGKTAVEVYDGKEGWFVGSKCPVIHGEPGKPSDFGNDLRAIRQFYQGVGEMSAGCMVHTLNSQFGWPLGGEEEAVAVAFDGLHAFPANVPNLKFGHDTDDEARTHAMNTYTMGAYGCRFGGQLLAPELIGV